MLNKKATILGNAISTYNLLLKDFRLNPELHMCTIFTKEYHIECSSLSRHDWYHNISNIKYWGIDSVLVMLFIQICLKGELTNEILLA